MTQPFVAVHVGAGFHSDANSKELRTLCKKACKEAMVALRDGVSSSHAATLAISILENSTQTNAAVGSNLSLAGTVECDASIMDGQGNFGAVGAVEGVVNPVVLAHTLLQESAQGCLPLGRVPPLVLAGTGARVWAEQHQIATCSSEDLITDRARAVYLDHIARLEGVTQGTVANGYSSDKAGDALAVVRPGEKRHSLEIREEGENSSHKKPKLQGGEEDGRAEGVADSSLSVSSCQAPLDTVGAICLDTSGRSASGVSSGGISLKSLGRVGQAAMFGCGCWADDEMKNSRAVACSTSGTGEYIIKTSLARECAVAMVNSSLEKALNEHFLNSKRLRNVDQKLAGAIALHLTPENVLHFSWGHTTESMCIGFMAGCHEEPQAVISKMENPERSGLSSHVEAIRIPP